MWYQRAVFFALLASWRELDQDIALEVCDVQLTEKKSLLKPTERKMKA
jgi:hypothetical protein